MRGGRSLRVDPQWTRSALERLGGLRAERIAGSGTSVYGGGAEALPGSSGATNANPKIKVLANKKRTLEHLLSAWIKNGMCITSEVDHNHFRRDVDLEKLLVTIERLCDSNDGSVEWIEISRSAHFFKLARYLSHRNRVLLIFLFKGEDDASGMSVLISLQGLEEDRVSAHLPCFEDGWQYEFNDLESLVDFLQGLMSSLELSEEVKGLAVEDAPPPNEEGE